MCTKGAALQYGVVVGLSKVSVPPLTFKELLDQDWCEAYIFSLEQSEHGHLHFQCWLRLREKHEGTWVQRKIAPLVGDDTSAIRWQKVRYEQGIQRYCAKERSHVSGPWYRGIAIPESGAAAPRRIIQTLWPWQETAKAICMAESDERKIHWFWEPDGSCGKTAFTLYMHYNCERTMCVDATTANDLYFAVASRTPKPHVMFIDIPKDGRIGGDFYRGLEKVKNRIFFCGKYESTEIVLDDFPVIIVFANRPPEGGKWSRDRYDCYRIVDRVATRYHVE